MNCASTLRWRRTCAASPSPMSNASWPASAACATILAPRAAKSLVAPSSIGCAKAAVESSARFTICAERWQASSARLGWVWGQARDVQAGFHASRATPGPRHTRSRPGVNPTGAGLDRAPLAAALLGGVGWHQRVAQRGLGSGPVTPTQSRPGLPPCPLLELAPRPHGLWTASEINPSSRCAPAGRPSAKASGRPPRPC